MISSASVHNETHLFTSAASALGVSLDDLASALDVDVSLLKGEDGSTEVPTEVLDGCARLLGLPLRRFLAGEIEGSASGLFFRSLHTAAGDDFSEWVRSSQGTLGEFVRCAHEAAQLSAGLGEASRLESTPTEVVAPPFVQAEKLAERARERFGLGLGPIDSMVSLMEGWGVSLFFVTPDELDAEIDGASVRSPLPAVLVNLVAGEHRWWRTRMTLAHELCHLLFDQGLMVSPKLRAPRPLVAGLRPLLPAWLEDVEKRANAFAAYFLAPPRAVRDLVGTAEPTSSESIDRVCKHFGMGRQSVVSHLTNLYGLSREERRKMMDGPATDLLPKKHADADVAVGLHSGVLPALVGRAIGAGKLSKLEARRILALRGRDALPASTELAAAERAPLLDATQRVRGVAQNLVASRRRGYFVAEVDETPEGYRVAFQRLSADRSAVPAGFMRLSTDLALVEEQLSP